MAEAWDILDKVYGKDFELIEKTMKPEVEIVISKQKYSSDIEENLFKLDQEDR